MFKSLLKKDTTYCRGVCIVYSSSYIVSEMLGRNAAGYTAGYNCEGF